MKITKRQLKQIIREEYSRPKKRGLIKENYDLQSYYEQIDEELFGNGPNGRDMFELEDALSATMPDFDPQLMQQAIEDMIADGVIERDPEDPTIIYSIED